MLALRRQRFFGGSRVLPKRLAWCNEAVRDYVAVWQA